MSKIFAFNDKNEKKCLEILQKYPDDQKRSALLPFLDIAQRQNGGYLSYEVIEYIAKRLDLEAIRVYEVASFYTMFNLNPVGKYHIQICGTTPCWLRGSDQVMKQCKKTLNIDKGETTRDGVFTLTEVECLGACVDAPVVQINDQYYENLDAKKVERLIDRIQEKEDNAKDNLGKKAK